MEVGQALGTLLEQEDVTRADLARRLGVTPSTITRLVQGEINVTLAVVRGIEAAMGWPRGRLLIAAGCVDRDQLGVPTVEAAIDAAPELQPVEREILVNTYRRFAEMARTPRRRSKR